MATAQKQRNSLSAVVFPNKTCTEQQSLVLVKRLLAISVSCITYLRGIFPECAYGTRYLDDLCVKILKDDESCPGSTQLVKWMLGCYDALHKKYLRLIVLAVYTNQEDPQRVTECYEFKFKYTDRGPAMDFISKNHGDPSNITCADTKKASILLIRKIYVLMQNLSPLPDDVCLTMKLFYYDEVTPHDYQPPGFKEGDCEDMVFEGEPTYLNVGEVPTPFHMLKVKVTTDRDRIEHMDQTILKQGASLPLSKEQHHDELQDQKSEDDFMTEDKLREQKRAERALLIGELNLMCEEDENMRTEESQNLSTNHSQVDRLVNKTSELEVTEGKTRSGKRFQRNTAGIESISKPVVARGYKETPKRSSLQSSEPAYHFEFSPSQDLGAKRRKFSEPKERF